MTDKPAVFRLELLLLLLLSACGAPKVAPPIGQRRELAPQRGGILRTATFVDIRTLDPATAFDEGAKPVEQLLFDELVDYDREGNIVPRLAERFDVSADGLRYSFHLHEGIRFHDGEEMTAEDVKRSIERTLAHDTPCPAPTFYATIKGFGPFHDGRLPAAGAASAGVAQGREYAPHLDGVVVDGRYALHIDLTEPDATFLPVMTLPFMAPVCKSAGAAYTREWGFSACGAGGFKLAEYTQGRQIRVVRHPGYWQPGLPYLDGVELATLMPGVTGRFKFEQGDLDFFREFTKPDSVIYRNDPAWRSLGQWEYPKSTCGIFLNTQMAPFDNRELRRAVAAAIDWSEVAALLPGHVVKATQMVPAAVAAHEADFEGQRFDLAAALEHMRLAGYPFDPKTRQGGYPGTVISVSNAGSFDAVAVQVIKQHLARIGIRIEIKVVSWPTFLAESTKRGHAAMGYGGWSMDFPDPSDFFEPILSTDAIQEEESQNAAFFSNPELDRVLKQAHRELDPAARKALYHRSEEIVRDEVPWAIGYAFRYYELAQPYVHDYLTDGAHSQDFRRVFLDPERGGGKPARLARLARSRPSVLALLRPWGHR